MRLDLSEAEPSRSCLNTATLLQTMERSFAHKGEIYEQLKEGKNACVNCFESIYSYEIFRREIAGVPLVNHNHDF